MPDRARTTITSILLHASEACRMPAARIVVVSVLLCGLFGMTAVNVAWTREDWPFSQYHMFALTKETTVEKLRLIGVTASGEMVLETEHTAPFDPSRLHQALSTALESSDPARAGEVVADFLTRYERRRLDGRHGGPALCALRLYRYVWTVDAGARNVSSPDSRQFILEIEGP